MCFLFFEGGKNVSNLEVINLIKEAAPHTLRIHLLPKESGAA